MTSLVSDQGREGTKSKRQVELARADQLSIDELSIEVS